MNSKERKQQREQKLRAESRKQAKQAAEFLGDGRETDYDRAHAYLKSAMDKCALAREAAR